MRRLIWSEAAASDLFRIADSYATVDPGLPDALLDRIVIAPRPLLDHPALGPRLGARNLRKWRVRNTPFLLIYAHRRDDAVEIVRVRHDREDWKPE